MSSPGGIEDDLRAELEGCFTVEQLVELSLDVVAWNRQKVPVSQGIDYPADDRRLSALTFDATGHHQVSGTL